MGGWGCGRVFLGILGIFGGFLRDLGGISVEIVGWDVVAGVVVWQGSECGDVDHGLVAFGALEAAVGAEEPGAGDEEALALECGFRDEQVGDAGFVFE